MSKPIEIKLRDTRRLWPRNLILNLSTFAFLALCIWLSKGSVWWTLVSSGLFLLAFASSAMHLVRDTTTEFSSLDELQSWIDRQRAIDAMQDGATTARRESPGAPMERSR